MARFNEILVARFAKFLQKVFGMKGGPPVPVLGSELTPVFPLFNGVENRFLEGWDRFATTQGQAAGGAGTFATLQLRNPSTSGAIVVIEKLLLGGLLADQVFVLLSASAVDQATSFTLQGRLDSRTVRNSSLIASKGIPAVQISAASLEVFFFNNSSVECILTDDQEITLLPGDRLLIQTNTANQALFFSCIFRERSLEDSEKF